MESQNIIAVPSNIVSTVFAIIFQGLIVGQLFKYIMIRVANTRKAIDLLQGKSIGTHVRIFSFKMQRYKVLSFTLFIVCSIISFPAEYALTGITVRQRIRAETRYVTSKIEGSQPFVAQWPITDTGLFASLRRECVKMNIRLSTEGERFENLTVYHSWAGLKSINDDPNGFPLTSAVGCGEEVAAEVFADVSEKTFISPCQPGPNDEESRVEVSRSFEKHGTFELLKCDYGSLIGYNFTFGLSFGSGVAFSKSSVAR